jgi:hypothetical protein
MSYLITPENHLIRRVPKQPSHIAPDAAGQLHLTSSVFKYAPLAPRDGVSVDVLEIWLGLGSHEQALHEAVFGHTTASGAGYVAAVLPAAVPINEGLDCVHDPIPATQHKPANPAHALILGAIDKTLARKLAKACVLVERSIT